MPLNISIWFVGYFFYFNFPSLCLEIRYWVQISGWRFDLLWNSFSHLIVAISSDCHLPCHPQALSQYLYGNVQIFFCFKIISSCLIAIHFPYDILQAFAACADLQNQNSPCSQKLCHYFCAESTSLILLCCSREPLTLFAFISGFAQLCSFINVKTWFSHFQKCTSNSSIGNPVQTVWLFLVLHADFLS